MSIKNNLIVKTCIHSYYILFLAYLYVHNIYENYAKYVFHHDSKPVYMLRK